MERDFLIEAYYAQEHDENESLTHHGIKGQHWGVRRYQNTDGSLTPEGRRHWGIGDAIRGAKTNVQKYVKSKKAAALRNKKNSILARGDVNEILKNKHLFTTNELDKAISRTQRMSMLEAMTPEKAAQRKKEAEAQAKATRGKEAVDRTLYRAGQLVQMAPAMIQCGAIVMGLVRAGQGHGPAPNASQVANAVTNATSSLSNPLAPASNSGGHGSGTIDQSHASSATSPYMNPNSTAPIYPNPSGGSHVSTGGGHNQNSSHASSSSSSSGSHATVEQAISSATYNPNKYKVKQNNQVAIYNTNPGGINSSTLPSWSNSTTNATFVNGLYEASTVPMSTLTSSDDWSDYVI